MLVRACSDMMVCVSVCVFLRNMRESVDVCSTAPPSAAKHELRRVSQSRSKGAGCRVLEHV